MFDYQAGEKYKLTLIMVAIAGVMAGMFFTVLLMPTPEAPQARKRQHQPWMDNPDVTGGRMPARALLKLRLRPSCNRKHKLRQWLNQR